MRTAKISRDTKETKISIELNLDGSGKGEISTGIGFFNHMLELLKKHALVDLSVKAEGDIDVDYHHTVEDVGIVLGKALNEALGDRRGRWTSRTGPRPSTSAGVRSSSCSVR